jgi:hypothetical protein
MLGLIQLIVIVLGLFVALGTAYNLIGDKNRAMVANWIANWTHAGFDAAVPVLNALENTLEPLAAAFVKAFQQFGGPIATDVQGALAPIVRAGFTASESGLTAHGASTPDNAAAMAADAMVDAFGFGISSAAVTAAFEAVFPEKLNVLNGAGPMLANLAGFEEISAAVRRPLYENAFGKSLEYHYRAAFRPELPDEFDAVLWHGRGLLSDAQLRDIFHFSGLKPEYENAFIQSGYRAVQPRALATAIQDTPFPRAEMQDLLKFNGYRDHDIQLMLDAFEGASTRNVRNQFLSATVTAAERGTLTPAEVDSALADLNFSDQAKHWVRLTIATRKLEQLAELYRKSISEAYKFSLITDAQYVPALEAIGIAAADANAHYAIDSEAKFGHEAAAAARAAARLAAETTRAAAAAALANYHSHNIDELALTAALAAAGVPAPVIPWAVDLAIVRRQASMRIVYGKEVRNQDAVLLREQVDAVKEQVIKKLLDTTSARTQLLNFGIPATNVEDLLARWAAQALKTVLPVQ